MDLKAIADFDTEIVTISQFNKGQAKNIFEEVEKDGHKVVMKNNKRIAIILSPQLHDALVEMVTDKILVKETERRIEMDDGKRIPFSEILKADGITSEELEGWEDIEFE